MPLQPVETGYEYLVSLFSFKTEASSPLLLDIVFPGENVCRAVAFAPAPLLFPVSALKDCADARRAHPPSPCL